MLRNYLKIALKVILRRKFFTFISLFAISFTLVVLMVSSAILDHLYAPMPPENKQDRTLILQTADMRGPENVIIGNPGYKLLDTYMRTLPDVERTSIFSEQEIVSAYKDGYDLKPYIKRTDGEFWKILEFTFLEGRPISDDDDKNANLVAVINNSTKEKFFGSSPAVGKYIEADRQSFRIIGVVADVPIFRKIPFADIWVPVGTMPNQEYKKELVGEFKGLILARSESEFPHIKEEFASRMKTVEMPSSDYTTITCEPGTMFDDTAREFFGNEGGHRRLMLTVFLFLGAFLFMLLPTINLININISRIIERASEIGVRKSFGASSATLVGQFIVENLLITAIGGLIGFLISYVVLEILTGSGWIAYAQFHLNYRIFVYALIFVLTFGLLSGVYPAWKMSRMHPVNALKGVVR
jgi:putative ABC transport system permease protein